MSASNRHPSRFIKTIETIEDFIASGNLRKSFILCLIGLGAFSFVRISSTLVDLPYWDEWEWLTPHFLGGGWKSKWFFGFANEHREIPTWLMAMANLELFNLNFKLQMILNLFFYAGMMYTLWRFVVSRIGEGRSVLAVLLLVPFLSSLNFENHTMSEQSCIHLCLWFFLLGIHFLFYAETPARQLAGATFLTLSLYSCASAIPGVTMAALVFLAWAVPNGDRRVLYRAAPVLLFVLAMMAIWFIGYEKKPHHPGFILPWEYAFHKGLAEIISLGFGFQQLSPVAWIAYGLVIFGFGLGAHQLRRLRGAEQKETAFQMSLLAGLLTILSVIVIARVGGGFDWVKPSRYFEYGVFLPVLLWALVSKNQRIRTAYGGALALVVVAGSHDDFQFKRYDEVERLRLSQERCVAGLLTAPEANPSGVCKGAYPNDISQRVRLAHKLGVKFAVRASGVLRPPQPRD